MKKLLFFLVLLTTLFFWYSSASAITIRSAPTNGLVGYWSFDTPTIDGTKVRDLTNKGGNGTMVGTPTPTKGKLNEGLRFSSTATQSVTTSGIGLNTLNSYTYSAWVNIDTLPAAGVNQVLVGDLGGYQWIAVTNASGGDTGFRFVSYSAGTDTISSGTLPDKGKWYHVVGVRSVASNTMSLYVNGAFVTSRTLTSANISASTNSAATMSFVAGYELKGVLDDVRIYNRALNSSEVKQVYQAEGVFKQNASQVYGPPTPTTNLQSGLVGFWDFSANKMGTTSALDSSSSRITGWLYGGTKKLAAKIGQGLVFDGSSGAVSLGVNAVGPKIHGNSASTVSAWVKYTGLDTGKYDNIFFINRIDSASAGLWFNVRGDAGSVGTVLVGGRSQIADAFQETTSGQALQRGVWYHVVGVSDYTGDKIKIYINGVLSTNTAVTFGSNTYTQGTPAEPWVDSISNRGAAIGDTATYPFNGSIDDVRVYNRQLSQAEITALYRAGGLTKQNATQSYLPPTPTTNLQSGLVGMWDFSAGKMGTTSALDASGNNNTGWLIGGAKKVIGKVGQGLAFDGSTGYVDLGTGTQYNFANTTFSVSAWFKTKNKSDNNFIVANKLTAGGWALFVGSGGITTDLKTSGGLDIASFNTTATTFADDKWHHAIGVFTTSTATNGGNTSYVYVDGVRQVGTFTAGAGVYFAPSPADNLIGKRTTGGFFPGSIDDVRIYNRAISQAEVTALYRLGK